MEQQDDDGKDKEEKLSLNMMRMRQTLNCFPMPTFSLLPDTEIF